jgi:hypothetical protein
MHGIVSYEIGTGRAFDEDKQMTELEAVAKTFNRLLRLEILNDQDVMRVPTDAGRMPRPLRLGGARRWDRVAIDDWIRSGCPAVASTTRRGGSKR